MQHILLSILCIILQSGNPFFPTTDGLCKADETWWGYPWLSSVKSEVRCYSNGTGMNRTPEPFKIPWLIGYQRDLYYLIYWGL